MDSGKTERDVSTPLTAKPQAAASQDETPKLDNFPIKQRHLDFNSSLAQEITIADNKPNHGAILTPTAVKSSTSLLLTTKVVSKNNNGVQQADQKKFDNDVMIIPPPADNNFKITLDKKQLNQLLNMEIERRKTDERKEQREKKEAELSAKREAKRKKEEERLRQQSEKKKAQQLQREQFLKFFKPSNTKGSNPGLKKQDTGWAPTFPVQPSMTLAKSPSPLQCKTAFDDTVKLQDPDFISSYITNHKSDQIKKGTNSPPEAQPVVDDDIVIVDKKEDKEKARIKAKFKLLQFCENYRPAYYGTCQKLSKVISPRNPFKKDKSLLDYTVDSDEEWEEEEPGESLSDCPSGDEGEDMEEEDDEDGFLVPHGYLSDDEGDLAAESADLTGSGDPNTSPKENRKEKMKMKEKAWEMEFARKCQPLKPCCVGCCWAVTGAQKDTLLRYQAVLLTTLPVTISFDQPEKAGNDIRTTPKAVKPSALKPSPQITKKPVPEEAMSDLIKLLQGSSIGLERTVKKFRISWGRKTLAEKGIQLDGCSDSDFEQASGISKRQLEMKINHIAKKVDRVWQVDETILKKYSVARSPSSSLFANSKSSPDHTKTPSSSVQSYHTNNQFITSHHLKENHLLCQEPINPPVPSQAVNKQDESPCGSPAKKRLKLTETQHVLLVQT